MKVLLLTLGVLSLLILIFIYCSLVVAKQTDEQILSEYISKIKEK